VPKKKKIVQDKSDNSPDPGGSFKVRASKGRRKGGVTASRKPKKTAVVKGLISSTGSMQVETSGSPDPSDETIRLRAYFISERRRRFALPGDAESDWQEAKRQLLSETGS